MFGWVGLGPLVGFVGGMEGKEVEVGCIFVVEIFIRGEEYGFLALGCLSSVDGRETVLYLNSSSCTVYYYHTSPNIDHPFLTKRSNQIETDAAMSRRDRTIQPITPNHPNTISDLTKTVTGSEGSMFEQIGLAESQSYTIA